MRRAQDAFESNTMWPSQNPFEPDTMIGEDLMEGVGDWVSQGY
mgnify:FL=1